MKKTPDRPCPLCDGAAADVLHTQTFALPEGHPLAAGYQVVCCQACGFVYADTTVTQADYDRFYATSSKYEDNGTSTGGGGAPWDEQRLADMARWLSARVPHHEARILDIGCANAGLLRRPSKIGLSAARRRGPLARVRGQRPQAGDSRLAGFARRTARGPGNVRPADGFTRLRACPRLAERRQVPPPAAGGGRPALRRNARAFNVGKSKIRSHPSAFRS